MLLKESQKYACDFCGKFQKDCNQIVVSGESAICDACVIESVGVLLAKLQTNQQINLETKG